MILISMQARLEGHSKAFEGLMSLIPAKYYYGEDNDVSMNSILLKMPILIVDTGSMAAQEANERTKASSEESKAGSSFQQDRTRCAQG